MSFKTPNKSPAASRRRRPLVEISNRQAPTASFGYNTPVNKTRPGTRSWRSGGSDFTKTPRQQARTEPRIQPHRKQQFRLVEGITPRKLEPEQKKQSQTCRKPKQKKRSGQTPKGTQYNPQGGVLKEIAADLFQRAHGLNGHAKEDHSVLFDEAHDKTKCSIRAFQDLLTKHTYDEQLADLRRQIPDYADKPVPKEQTPAKPTVAMSGIGCLKDQAQELFQRAYGLNGRETAEYSDLLDATRLSTGCSQRAFEELIFGHTYGSVLNGLRDQVPGYMSKVEWKLFCKDMSKVGESSVVTRLNSEGGRKFLAKLARDATKQETATTTPQPNKAKSSKHLQQPVAFTEVTTPTDEPIESDKPEPMHMESLRSALFA